jgi:gamma-glutamyltranspeptidase/glutathione hydrolase
MVDIDKYNSRRSTVYGQRGVVSTSQPLAAQAGIETLRRGGNAFDAAVATAAALNVVEPTSTGIGGDVFGLYRTADGDVGAMRSCGGAPAEATVENVRHAVADEEDEDPEDVEMPDTGPHTVTVPGTARGWETTVEELGRLTLSAVLEPAIRYAEEGYPVTEIIASHWSYAEELFEDDHAREAYLLNDRAPKMGETMRLPKLGSTMQAIADEGADVVYEGHVADAIAHEVQSKGGFLTVDDLAAFEPEFLDPVSTTYNGVEVFELPPNNQGLIALEALNIAQIRGAGEHDLESVERVHEFAEATRLAFHDGHRYITDPEYEEIPPLNSQAYAEKRAENIGEERMEDVSFGVPNANAEDADTVLLCVADDEGNVVSYINSRFAGFGSGLVAGDTGIALQNRGASFSLDRDHPNRLEPGKRPFHTLVPAVARLDEALDEPRWRYREDGTLAVEEHMASGLATKLARKGHDVRILPGLQFGGAQIVRNDDGTLSGATEPRKDGLTVGY